eukprot:356183-Chlamydomonas_euryale.AAC.1
MLCRTATALLSRKRSSPPHSRPYLRPHPPSTSHTSFKHLIPPGSHPSRPFHTPSTSTHQPPSPLPPPAGHVATSAASVLRFLSACPPPSCQTQTALPPFPTSPKDTVATSAASVLRFLAACPGFVEAMNACGALPRLVDACLTAAAPRAAYLTGILWEVCSDETVARAAVGCGAVPVLLHVASRFVAAAGGGKKKAAAGSKDKKGAAEKVRMHAHAPHQPRARALLGLRLRATARCSSAWWRSGSRRRLSPLRCGCCGDEADAVAPRAAKL